MPPDVPLLEPAPRRSSNVRRLYVILGLYSLSLALWNQQLLSLYLITLPNVDTRQVGIAEGAQGVARLCSAIFLGIAVDKLPRNLVLRLGAIYGVVVHAWLLVLVGFSDAVLPTSLHAHRIYLWYGTLPCFAIFDALANVVGAVVFADSVKTGSRVGPYTTLMLSRQAGLLVGPTSGLVYFAATGTTTWSEATLRPVMLAGVCVGALSAALLLTLDHGRTLGTASDAQYVQPAAEPAAAAEAAEQPLNAAPRPTAASRDAARVRWLIFSYDLLRVLSGGLIVKYWGLYFAQGFGMTPPVLQAVDATRVVLCLAFTKAAGWCCQRKYVSRSVACLLLLVVVDCGNFATAFGTSVWVAVPGWLARASANNGVFGLKQSLLADYTPKGRRGRWNAVDSLQAGVWSGTAVVGGYLIHAYGYQLAFLAMSCGFVGCTCIWVPLALIERRAARREGSGGGRE